jgi:hypothetical protein
VIVRLNGERVVLRYEVPKGHDWEPSGSVCLVVHDTEVTGSYLMLWRTSTNEQLRENEYELMWKGSWETVLEKFTDEIDSFESDNHLELERDALQKAQGINTVDS